MIRRFAFVCVVGLFVAVTAGHTNLEEEISDLKSRLNALEELESRRLNATSTVVLNTTLTEADLMENIQQKIDDFAWCLDSLWLLVCGALVMFMQAGFAILESGTCREKNGAIVLMKNLVDVCLGTIFWYFFGYGFAYGEGSAANNFIGNYRFFGQEFLETSNAGDLVGTAHLRDWFFQWAFCATAATIVSGGVAERIKFVGYVVYSVIMTSLIYPVVVHWTWTSIGFLSDMGYSDFAGSGIVHLTGGIGALAGAIIVGPRAERWNPDVARRFDPHNMALVVLGTFILWFGWYGFNCGSTLALSDKATAIQAALVAMNTTLAAAVGGLTVFILRFVESVVQKKDGKFDMAGTCNGILAGLVAVCAGVGDIEPGFAVLTGFLGGLAYEFGHVVVQKLKIDDPLDAFAVHGCGGIMGMVTRPLFDKTGVDSSMFSTHCLAILCIVAWSGGMSALTFAFLRVTGLLCMTVEEQQTGSDKEMAQGLHGQKSLDEWSPSTSTSSSVVPKVGAGGAV